MKTLCVMPVYNQMRELPQLLDACRTCMPADILYIVDNGSTDGSRQLLEKSGFQCLVLNRNFGVGYALRLGAEKAVEMGYDIVANIAGNGKMCPSEMNRVLAPIKEDDADYVTGSRFLRGGSSPNLPLFRRISIPLVVNNLVRILFRFPITDATNGFRAYRTDLLKNPKILWKQSWLYHYQFEYYIYAKALQLGYRCKEVPTTMRYPNDKKNYTKMTPIISWWEMLQPWLLVGLGIK